MNTKDKYKEIALGLISILYSQYDRIDEDTMAAFNIIQKRFYKVRRKDEERGPDLVIESEDLLRMARVQATSENFCAFMDALDIQTTNHFDKRLDRPCRYDKFKLWADFKAAYADEAETTIKKFTNWIRYWTHFKLDLLEFDIDRDQYRSNGDVYIFFRSGQ